MRHCSNKQEIQIHCFDTSSQLPAAWDSFIPQDHFLSRNHLATTEQALLPDLSYTYVLIVKNEQPVAASYFQLLKLKKHHLNEQSLPVWQQYAWQAFTGMVKPRLLVAGHLFRHDVTSYYASDKISDYEAYQYYRNAIDTVLYKSCAYAVLVKDVPEALVTYFRHYAPQYLMLRNDIMMEMNIPSSWQDMRDYEKALKHKYAQRFRKIRQNWGKVNVHELNTEEVELHKQEIFNLYKQVCEKQTARIGILSPDFIPLLKKQYPDTYKVWLILEGSTIIGFFSAWLSDDAFDMFYIGFDYAKNNELQLYFNILFFGVEQAILNRKSKAIFGRTALDAKARLGCKPHYKSTFVFVRNRWIRMITLRIQNNSQSLEGSWEQRHPLKEALNTNS